MKLKRTYALALCGPIDELLVGVFGDEEGLREFAAENDPREKTPALRHAAEVRGIDPLSRPFGYLATELLNGIPSRTRTFYWVEDGGTFDPDRVLFPDGDEPVVAVHDGDHTGGGPVG